MKLERNRAIRGRVIAILN